MWPTFEETCKFLHDDGNRFFVGETSHHYFNLNFEFYVEKLPANAGWENGITFLSRLLF